MMNSAGYGDLHTSAFHRVSSEFSHCYLFGTQSCTSEIKAVLLIIYVLYIYTYESEIFIQNFRALKNK